MIVDFPRHYSSSPLTSPWYLQVEDHEYQGLYNWEYHFLCFGSRNLEEPISYLMNIRENMKTLVHITFNLCSNVGFTESIWHFFHMHVLAVWPYHRSRDFNRNSTNMMMMLFSFRMIWAVRIKKRSIALIDVRDWTNSLLQCMWTIRNLILALSNFVDHS